jgi:proteasome lid subunit RPN8/RPN11
MWYIYKDVLESIMQFSKSFYPREFSALLYCKKNIIDDIYILPGTRSNETSAVLRMDLAPMSLNIKGSVHSHPSGFGLASNADKQFFFSKQVNIIVYYPFGLMDFKVYSKKTESVILEIITRKTPK